MSPFQQSLVEILFVTGFAAMSLAALVITTQAIMGVVSIGFRWMRRRRGYPIPADRIYDPLFIVANHPLGDPVIADLVAGRKTRCHVVLPEVGRIEVEMAPCGPAYRPGELAAGALKRSEELLAGRASRDRAPDRAGDSQSNAKAN